MLAYLRLMLRDRLLALHPASAQKAGKSKWKATLGYVGFILIFLMLYGMLVAFEYFVFQGFKMIGEPQGMLTVVFLVCVFLTLILSFFYVFSTLFFSRDIGFVSALPISSRGLLFVKLLVIVLEEAAIALIICLPTIVLYGMETGAGFWLYAKFVLFVPFLPVIPIAIVTLLSCLLIRVSALWKRREGVTTIASFLLVAGIVAWQMSFSMSVSDEQMAQFFVQFVLKQRLLVDVLVGLFPPIRWICDGFLLQGALGWMSGFLFAGVSCLAAMLALGLVGGGYQSLAVKQSEVVARMNAQGRKSRGGQGRRSPLRALYMQELKEIATVPAYATNCGAALVMFPIMAVVMLLGAGNAMKDVPALSLVLERVPRMLFLAIAAAVFCFTSSMNMAVSTAVSREGKRRYVSKIIPVTPGIQLLAKLLVGLTLSVATMLTTGIVMVVALPAFWLETLGGCLIGVLFAVLSSAAGLLLDVYRPRLGWKTETEAIKRNVNGVFSMFGTMLAVLLLGAGVYGLHALGLGTGLALAVVTLLIVLLDVVMLKWMFGKGSVTYYLQEKFD